MLCNQTLPAKVTWDFPGILASFSIVTVFYDAALIMFQEIKEDYAKSLNHYEMALGAIIKLLPGKWIHLRP